MPIFLRWLTTPFRFARRMLGIPFRTIREIRPDINGEEDTNKEQDTPIYDSDILFNLVVYFPLFLSPFLLLMHVWRAYQGTTTMVWLPAYIFPMGISLAIWLLFGVRVDYPGEFIARIFLGRPKYFFQGWILDIPRLSRLINVSLGAHFVRTPEKDEKAPEGIVIAPYEMDELRKRALRTRIRQGAGMASLQDVSQLLKEEQYMARFIGTSGEQIVILKILFEVDAWHRPTIFLKRFTEILKDHAWNFQDAWNRLTNMVANLIVARSDQIFGTTKTDEDSIDMMDCMLNREKVNQILQRNLQKYLNDLGIKLTQIMVEDVFDLDEDGFIHSVDNATNATNRSTSDQQVAVADQRARVIEAEQQRVAAEKEQDVRKLIAGYEKDAWIAVAASKEVEAEAVLKLTKARIQLFSPDNPMLGVLLSKFEGTPYELLPPVLKEALSALGIHLEGGTLVTLDNIAKVVPAGVLNTLIQQWKGNGGQAA